MFDLEWNILHTVLLKIGPALENWIMVQIGVWELTFTSNLGALREVQKGDPNDCT